MKKTFRQGQILNLIRSQTIRTQDELATALKKHGIDATQVTLSRDVRELGLVKGRKATASHRRRLPQGPRWERFSGRSKSLSAT